MRISGRAFWCPKAGMRSDEYEDAFAPLSLGRENGLLEDSVPRLRVAVADGATESSFSQLWARILTRAFCRGLLPPDGLPDRLRRPQDLWARLYRHIPLPWYAEEKRRLGAFAAFVGLKLSQTEHGRADAGSWTAWAVGDCCAFQVRGDRVLARFPLSHSREFNSRPVLVPSVASWNGTIGDAVRVRGGRWRADDRFYLMSDALAAWFMQESEARQRPLLALRTLSSGGDRERFPAWIDDLRTKGALRNDDVTLVSIETGSQGP